MAFPASTPTSQPAASALLSNNAASAGLTNATPFDRLTNLEQVVANLLTDLPGAINAVINTATGTIGFATGAGGAVTQATNKSTGVTLSKPVGQITMNNANLATVTAVSFTLTNTLIAANDLVVVNHSSAGTAGAYLVGANTMAAGSCKITVYNVTAGTLGEAIVLSFAIIKGAAA